MSKTVKIRDLKVGGKNPVRIKGMLKTQITNKKGLLREALALQTEGADAIRVAVKRAEDASIVGELKKVVKVPLVADVHFHYKTALAAIESGFDSIRWNPLNITDKDQVRTVIKAAKKAKVSIRVGVNSGGFKQRFATERDLALAMLEKISESINLLEAENFFDIMVSLKASTVDATVLANRLFREKFDYPLHLGVTATGPFVPAIVKSAIGIGMLLKENIGDVIRVSLTGPSFWEIRVAKSILQAIGKLDDSPEIISCPTCSRCQVDLISLVENFEKEVLNCKKKGYVFPKKIALMGCEVNGPGEACQADIGVAFGKDKGSLFKKDKIIGSVSAKISMKNLVKKLGGK
ncbi:MAG: (E)-4-hydroxy-3-methylbut-2-enyl-diphosphate synthase [Candidatus Omnitrophica bacterium]|nr:(E)-4-hydroxy-3-methylbut-2-enyl-diphosphate synthase [Candidatus Omnitrophota bacterium]